MSEADIERVREALGFVGVDDPRADEIYAASSEALTRIEAERKALREFVDLSDKGLGRWMSGALDDPKVCQSMRDDIIVWFASLERALKSAPQQGDKPDNSTVSRTLAADTSERFDAENSSQAVESTVQGYVGRTEGEATPRVEPAQGDDGLPSKQELMRAIHTYQERTGQTLEDTLAGKWTHEKFWEKRTAVDGLVTCSAENDRLNARLKECVDALNYIMKVYNLEDAKNAARTTLENVSGK